MKLLCKTLLLSTLLPFAASAAETVLVEAESLKSHGGWTLDTQFVELMGSPYLIAHGLGKPVANAEGTVTVKTAGKYRVLVRTKDWVAQWKAPGTPGKFQVLLNGKPLPETLGTTGENWQWQAAGAVELAAGQHQLALKDLTGFDGRCDAIILTSDTAFTPPNDNTPLGAWRRQALGLPHKAPDSEEYDLVVVGGGYSGMGAAISAARMGIKVALLQNRPVLGGNGSSEIQVWAQGGTRRGKYPHLGEIVEEFADFAKDSPGTVQEYGDAKKEEIVRAEKNLSLFLNAHAIGVGMASGATPDERQIAYVAAMDTRTGAETHFRGKFFVDCTGHGYVAELAGAKSRVQEKEHMGMSNMWSWGTAKQPVSFPATPWALTMKMGDFPPTIKAKGGEFWKGEWFWESGFDLHPLQDLETTRDWNLRAVFGAFQAMKSGPEAAKYTNAELQWVAVIGGTRESRNIDGDLVLTEEDIVKQTQYPDGCVPTTWDIDLHYAKEQYAKKFPENPFISRAAFGKGVDKTNGYPVPYRCFYSKNVGNLFMAGRNISVTHEALGTIRVMRTCGMMGEVVGKAASICIQKNATPRKVYTNHLADLIELMQLPGAARRATVAAPMELPSAPVVFATSAGDKYRTAEGAIAINKLQPGMVIDDDKALLEGSWTEGTGLRAFVGKGYRYAGKDSNAQAIYAFTVPQKGTYDIRVGWQPHENRATNAKCQIEHNAKVTEISLNQQQKPKLEHGFESVAQIEAEAGATISVAISAAGANGNVHADAVWLVPTGK